MSKFKRINLTVKSKTLDKLLNEYISGHAPSRASVAASCFVSKVTSGKVADALIGSGFMDGRIFSVGDERPSTHLLFNDRSSILIFDLSTSVYKMCVVNPTGKILLSLSHIYDPEVSFEDNLNIFISRNGLKLKKSKLEFAAMSVLYADACRQAQLDPRISFLPPISLSAYVEEVIFTILGKRVSSHLTLSEAIGEAVKFKAIKLYGNGKGISYIFIGNRISSFHVYENGSAAICSPENILSREELSDLAHIRMIPKEKRDALFIRIADFMDAAFSPSVLLLASDVFSPDSDTADKICRKLALTGTSAPVIYTRDSSFPIEYVGAARYTLLTVIKKYITSNNS
ncbi:MAG: hypothetical protein IKJ24_03820 [Clostridia bacterium]|nr:hypothetical protein [Clostridia bacterium]